MLSEHSPEDDALYLAPGARVGAWRVVERQGYGGFGIVYRAVRAGQEHAGSVALKLARCPWERRFAREAELLWRIRDANSSGRPECDRSGESFDSHGFMIHQGLRPSL
jgi:hypothetical protein